MLSESPVLPFDGVPISDFYLFKKTATKNEQPYDPDRKAKAWKLPSDYAYPPSKGIAIFGDQLFFQGCWIDRTGPVKLGNYVMKLGEALTNNMFKEPQTESFDHEPILGEIEPPIDLERWDPVNYFFYQDAFKGTLVKDRRAKPPVPATVDLALVNKKLDAITTMLQQLLSRSA